MNLYLLLKVLLHKGQLIFRGTGDTKGGGT